MTLRDVARAAGVSPATASRALSSPELVAPARREQVQRVARELGYRPNRAARELITGRTGNLCLVVPDLENPFFAAVAKGVQARARTLGYAVFVADAEEDPRLEPELVAHLGAQVDGAVLCSPRMSDEDLDRLAEDVPLVLVNRRHRALASVVIDNADGVRQAVTHLHALGHTRIAYVGGPADSWSDARRREGLAHVSHGLRRVEVVDLGPFAPVFAGGVAAGDLVAASGATAVLAHNDLVALGILSRLQARGLRVPQDVSVVGYDDIPAATLVSPALTTVTVPLARLGREAVDLLVAHAMSTRRGSAAERVVAAALAAHRDGAGGAPGVSASITGGPRGASYVDVDAARAVEPHTPHDGTHETDGARGTDGARRADGKAVGADGGADGRADAPAGAHGPRVGVVGAPASPDGTGEPAPQPVRLRVELVVRASTGPVPTRPTSEADR
ncbi:LacI family DNA-binding transcriptional regulator [Cellulomonas fimi]|uniref:LacI family DNA-binding transcriptional regulator n=1 Tax=Cellulomonas fimi TaxID=1708 RepID=UPI001E2CB363|nr:LacI family DNA-binding transcriptional regulator [Cellulomonas fimi]